LCLGVWKRGWKFVFFFFLLHFSFHLDCVSVCERNFVSGCVREGVSVCVRERLCV